MNTNQMPDGRYAPPPGAFPGPPPPPPPPGGGGPWPRPGPSYGPQWQPMPPAPPGYPPTGFTPPAPGPPPPPHGSRRTRRIVMAVIAALVVAGAATGTTLFLMRGDGGSDRTKITQVANEFADATNTGDVSKMTPLMCSEEAQALRDNTDDIDPADLPDKPEPRLQFDVKQVSVRNDVAEATITFPKTAKTTQIYFRKESGDWKVCAPAEQQMKQTS